MSAIGKCVWINVNATIVGNITIIGINNMYDYYDDSSKVYHFNKIQELQELN